MEGTRRSSRSNKGKHSQREIDSYVAEESDHDRRDSKRLKLSQTSDDDDEYMDGNTKEPLKDHSNSSSLDSDSDEVNEADDLSGEKSSRSRNLSKSKTTGSKHDGKDADADVADEVRCNPCGTNKDNYDEETDSGGMMIQCESCNSWQHAKCMKLNPKKIPDNYKCDVCSQLNESTPVGQLGFQKLNDKTRISVAKAFFNVLKTQIPKDYKHGEGLSIEDVATKWALELEAAVFKNFPAKDRHYTDKGRGTMTLIKKPNVLSKIIDGTFTFEKLVTSSPEEIDDDLKHYAEKVRQESIRRSVLTAEETGGQRIRRTHKGEEIVEDVSNDNRPEEQDVNIVTKAIDHRRFETDSTPPKAETNSFGVSEDDKVKPDPTSFSYNTVGLDDDDDDDDNDVNGQDENDDDDDVTKIGYDQSGSDSDNESDSDDDADLKKILHEEPKNTQTPKPAIKSAMKPAAKPAASAMKKSALKNSGSNLPPMAPTSIWEGRITFPDFASFPATSEFISATNYSTPKSPLDVKFHNHCIDVSKEIFQRSFYDVEGRLDRAKADPYLGQVSVSRDFYLFSIKPAGEHEDYEKLYGYLLQRGKVGVLSGKPLFAKDSYLVSLDGKNIPGYLGGLNNVEGKSGLFALYVVKKDYTSGIERQSAPKKSVSISPPPPPSSIPAKPSVVKSEPPILESILNKLSSGGGQQSFGTTNQQDAPNSSWPVPSNNSIGGQSPAQFQSGQGLTTEQMGILSSIVQDNPQAQQNPQELINLLQQQQQQQQYQQYPPHQSYNTNNNRF